MTMRAMGIDFGISRIGIALSDETKFLARPYSTYYAKHNDSDIQYFVDLIKKENVDELVCGLPFNMMGEEQDIAKYTREFIGKIQNKIDIKVSFIDERLSSVMSDDILKQTERNWRKRKEKLDRVSATIILQDYLDKIKRS